ncbi:ABC transporter ATP-binding protein [Longimycelium tulufanense]|uniref:ABC transporter ATP-binding protein n=1 Tax=Longimycelium tulufanense TaxID=907463 RepID=A0A8J3CCP9_9PSEU|nr:ABC transporter ATP-binding protein [Longimycelium tulufanense]GGM74857.1 ABC transporter ATP-binding protein [Longimycelium tulufanense]
MTQVVTTQEPQRKAAPPQEESWRGVALEDQEEVEHAVSAKLQARSRRLLGSLLRPHASAAVLALLIVLAENVAQLAGPLLIAGAIDSGVPAALGGDPAPLAWYVAGYAASGLVSGVLRFAFLRLSGRIGQDVLFDLRQRVFRHAQRLSLSFHEKYTSGRLISRLTSDLESLDDLLEMGLDGVLSALLTVGGVAVLLLWLDLRLALVVLAGFVPLFLLTRWFRRRSQVTYRRTRTTIARVIVQFTETMNGMRAVQAFRRESRNERIMAGLNEAYRDANRHSIRLVAHYTAGVRLVGNVSMAVVLAYGGWLVAHGDLELGVLAAFLLYLRKFYDPLDELSMFLNSYAAAAAALEKISGVLQEEPTVAEPARPTPLPDARGELACSDVEFRYSADGPVVLPRFDLHVPAGQTVALVGATGAGKSTLAKLFARFYDPSSGKVALDGVDLRKLSEADLRRAVVMVTQESFLFEGTVADNIALGRPGASRVEVEAAAAAVGAHEFVSRLPEGYDTDVRKRGGRLSAGQRQLVSFARALLADPAVLVLDEATSSLDIPTERAVQAALETVLADRTALIIAHRLSTVLIADRVLVVDQGRIVEDGPPAELIAGRGRFAALHHAWRDSLV